jgi:hypothetical protein
MEKRPKKGDLKDWEAFLRVMGSDMKQAAWSMLRLKITVGKNLSSARTRQAKKKSAIEDTTSNIRQQFTRRMERRMDQKRDW